MNKLNKIINTVKNSKENTQDMSDNSEIYLSEIEILERDEQLRRLDEEKKIKYEESKRPGVYKCCHMNIKSECNLCVSQNYIKRRIFE